ncbi:MAG TPA: carboxypeptidase regulatory-like domain-containing protein, partial [Thermoanaerobaculia bacterium]|nr:carboxypeptidase regulatory-like domain-containing protein [Thermoanaerobaculia bacterium]
MSLALALVFILATAMVVQAQVTTGTLAGTVTAASDGSALPGVTIEAVHVPTGTHYTSVTNANGRYEIPNVRVGGPYRITSTLSGFKNVVADNVTVRLGETAEVPLKMELATVTEAITVTATPDTIINPSHTGSTSQVSKTEIELLPTVNRTLQDMARTNPYFAASLTDDTSTFLSVAGTNNRYNDIKIDGAVNNDVFGLASSGTPGGQAGTQPIPLDALEQLQLVVTPYDVRQSGFTGGGINAVTRSGTNQLTGSVFGTRRDPSYVGKGPSDTKVSDFSQTQYGGRIGGPILRDKLFFFLSGERNKRHDPQDFTPFSNSAFPTPDEVASYVQSTYGVNLGGAGPLSLGTDSKLLFGRLDYNIGNANNLTLRHNYVDASRDNTPSSAARTSSRFYFPTSIYPFLSKTNSTVGQLNSVFGASMYNEARVNYTTVRDQREVLADFPSVEIGGSERNGNYFFGTERFSGANSLDQNILEITDDLTRTYGAHTLVLGTSNQWFDFKNLFIQDINGYYHFRTWDDFLAGNPDIYRISFANGSNPKAPTAFKAGQYSLYASDQWHAQNNLTLTFGLRLDKPHYDTTPSFNPAVQNAIGFSTATTPSESIIWEPRVGFNWDPTGQGRQQLRGGVGVFLGRAPYVWISNNYGNTGVETTALGCLQSAGCTPPAFNADPNNQPRNLGSGAASTINVVDSNFQFPRVLRATLGYDRDLWWGIKGTAEVLYSKTQKDVFYYNVNKVQTGTSPLDGRPVYGPVSTSILDAILLSNTQKGNEMMESVQFNKDFRNLTITANYAHQNAKTVGEGQSSIAYSNWQFNQLTRGDIFKQELGTSSFEIEHRFNIAATYRLNTGLFTHGFG